MKTRWSLHLLGVALLAAIVCLLFLREPGFGDDFTYWSFAFDLHEEGLKTWSQNSFHDLRWPVWGVSWVLQAIFGPGLLSYYGVPMLYLIAGSILSFTFAQLITGSVGLSWAASVAFLFHPLLDTVCYRPMPDLSEGVIGGAAVLTWWYLSQAKSRTASIALAFLLGTLIYVAESNRVTGVFIVPVLLVATLLYARRTFGWLVLAGMVSLAFYVAEAAFYHHLFGDWLHNLHANMGAKGKKGTESIAFWYLPFRFLDTLWKGNPLAPVYCILAIIGGWAAWTRRSDARIGEPLMHSAPPLGKITVLWLVIVYLEYACAPQQIWPWRPLIRDADRFLAGTVPPFSILAAIGLGFLLNRPELRRHRWARWASEHPIACSAAAVVLLVLVTSREFIHPGSLPKLRAYIGNRAPGTTVFTHEKMRAYAFLTNPGAAKKLKWLYKSQILHFRPELEAMAAEADEFWYIRKLVWLNTRKELEQQSLTGQQRLASYFAEPERDWTMTQLLAKGDTPDLIFYRKRQPDTPPARVLTANAPELGGIVPMLPIEWKGSNKEQSATAVWKVPADLQGKLCRLTLEAASSKVEAFNARLTFFRGKKEVAEYLLKPYLYPVVGKEFFAFELPAEADRCEVTLKLGKGVDKVRFENVQLLVESPKQ